MALTVPIDTEEQASRPVVADRSDSDSVIHRADVRQVQLYCRLAAAVSALAFSLAALGLLWLATRLVHWRGDSRQTLLAFMVVVAAAGVLYLRAEMRVRSYRLELTADAVVFAIGRTRACVPREHIQLLDTESSILLRIFRLKRCRLHTGGGTIIVSPVPASAAAAIERLISERPAAPPIGSSDAGA